MSYALPNRYNEHLVAKVDESTALNSVSLQFLNVFGPHRDSGGECAAVTPVFIDRMVMFSGR